MKRNNLKALLVTVSVLASTSANAALSIDTTQIVADLGSVGVAAGVIGVASLAVYMGIRAYKMVRGAM